MGLHAACGHTKPRCEHSCPWPCLAAFLLCCGVVPVMLYMISHHSLNLVRTQRAVHALYPRFGDGLAVMRLLYAGSCCEDGLARGYRGRRCVFQRDGCNIQHSHDTSAARRPPYHPGMYPRLLPASIYIPRCAIGLSLWTQSLLCRPMSMVALTSWCSMSFQSWASSTQWWTQWTQACGRTPFSRAQRFALGDAEGPAYYVPHFLNKLMLHCSQSAV